MIQFYFCENFKKNTKSKEFEDIVYNKFAEYQKHTDLTNTGNVTYFGKLCVLRTSNPNTRTIIEPQNIKIDGDDVRIFFVRDIIANKRFDYTFGKVVLPQIRTGEWLRNNPLSENDRKSFITKYKNQKSKKIKKRVLPPQELTAWLAGFEIKPKNEIFETEDWVKYALNSSLADGMTDKYVNTFRLVLEEITTSNSGNTQLVKEQFGIQIKRHINHDIGILYSKIEIDFNKNVYLLYNGAHIKKQEKHWKKAISEIKLNDIEIKNNIESVSRKAFRSYPKWTVGKDELWFTIQKSTEMSNLSLTREQIDFFNTFKFPYYINGQAGSGKSTMLYYLFANTYYYKCSDEIQDEIIFLTENEILLERTKNSVFDLLTNNPEFSGLSVDQRNQSKKYFNSFKRFLVDMLPENGKQDFKENKYLDFSKFKQLYENSYLSKSVKDEYSAEESWFTIITYIYGYDFDDKITSKNYIDAIPNKSQRISKTKFIGIEENILPFYEKLIEEEGYWDKLKIIRHITKNISLTKKYSVIICDEAQDFCRVELRFILRLSKYLEYDLSETEQVPIIFAGDPNQTVNPTGFRQGEMTSMLYEELKEIAKFNYNKEENIYNPSFNYRSAQPVVSVANFMQYHRMKNLGIKQVKPQEAKRPNSNLDKDFNIFLNYETIDNDTILKQDLVEKLKYKIFVIPVNAQEKEEYISKHNLLSLIDKVEVKTSVEAKGAEYEQVVLFGFGEYFLENFESLSENKSDTDELFKRGFFFNKLYVGLTRAQTELIIIDNESSEELFWKKIVNNVEISTEKWKNLNKFKTKTIEYGTESIKNIIQSTPEDALKNAEKDKEQGLYDKNPARLKVAANQFFRVGQKEEGYECLALSEEIKENWQGAADYYLNKIFEVPKYEEAAICLFKGRFFNELVSRIGNNLKSIVQDVRLIISRIISGEKLMTQDIEILWQNKNTFDEITRNIEWRDELISQIILSAKKIELTEQRKDFVLVMKSIAKSGDRSLWMEVGNINFELKQYQEAIDAWTEIDYYETNEKYHTAQVNLAKLNKNPVDTVLWLDALLKFKPRKEKNQIYTEIIKIYNQNKSESNDIFYFQITYKALIMSQPTNPSLIDLGKYIEKQFDDKQGDLKSFYENLLDENNLDSKVVIYILERWIKTEWKLKKTNKEFNLNKINAFYEKLAQKYDIIYRAFQIDEIMNIPDLPSEIKITHSQQYQNITIHNFRRFKQLSLSNTGQYNLIVGDNNVGKTSLLEALLFTPEMSKYVEYLAFAFIYRKNIPIRIIDNEENYRIPNDFLINDFVRNDVKNNELEFEIIENRTTWNYKVKTSSEKEVVEKYGNRPNIDIEEYITIISDNSQVEILHLPSISKKISPSNIIKSSLIPFGKGFGQDLASAYYTEIEIVKSKRNQFLDAMKVFIPNIERINANTKTGEIDIEETGLETSAPLHQFGEGANKLFRILVQITLQNGKRLLIDEIDAGIHYSHFSTFWKTILTVAEKNNVQIFATTHNIECVNYFAEILKEETHSSFQNSSRIITLKKLPDENIKAFTRIFSEFEYELDNEFEIRGGDL